MTEWRRSPVIAVAAVVMFLVIQLAIPMSRIGPADQGQRFGWQMFALVSQATEFTVHTPAGDEVIALDSVLARVRGDLDLDALLPPFLCETVEGATTVTWDDQTFTCLTT